MTGRCLNEYKEVLGEDFTLSWLAYWSLKNRKGNAMNATKSTVFGGLVIVALVGAWLVSPPLASGAQASFALLNEPGGDTLVFCTVTPGPFSMHITMTNLGNAGGVNGFVRVTYQDGDGVSYAIPVNTTVQISLAGGSAPGLDDAIRVSGDGAGGSVLAGQVSVLATVGLANCSTF